jgi:Ser/Thr protein kinase RdoA (MazF antagonist)
MSLFDEQPPLIDSKVLLQWLKSNYSIFNTKDIKIKSLNSERDKNFLIKGVRGKYYVVKISHPSESIKQLNYQDHLIKYLRSNLSLAKIYPKICHKNILFYNDLNQRKCAVRILTFIDGKCMRNPR